MIERKISEFLMQYVTCQVETGIMPEATIIKAIGLLLSEGVFASKIEMKKEALRTMNLIIPERYFRNGE